VSARKQAVRLNRREFLIAGTGVAGSLVLGLPRMTAADGDERMLGFFVQINADGSIVIGSNQPEIGQGVRTALPMLVAEELDVEWSTVSVRQMPLGIVKTADGYAWKYGGQGVGGSTGLTSNWDYMREVGATARRGLHARGRRNSSQPTYPGCGKTPGRCRRSVFNQAGCCDLRRPGSCLWGIDRRGGATRPPCRAAAAERHR
jgi:hypothetical protein